MSGGTGRRLAKCHNIEDLRRAARRRLPRPLFDFLDGGAEDERSLRRNRTGFERTLLAPRVLRDVSRIDTATTVLGVPVALPLIVAPTGMPALFSTTAARTPWSRRRRAMAPSSRPPTWPAAPSRRSRRSAAGRSGSSSTPGRTAP